MNKITPVFRVDEVSEPLNAIMMTKEFLERSGQGLYYLKWTLLAVHNALQGFMVLALKGTSNLSIIKWKDKYDGKSPYEILSDPEQKLCCFTELFKRIKSKKYMQNTVFKDESGKITHSIKELNRIRNQFIHYIPLGWSIGTQGMVDILADSMLVISFLTGSCIAVKRYYEGQQLSEISLAIETCNSILLKYRDSNSET
jgi:hypothetical protein